jgi:hypothetical protein
MIKIGQDKIVSSSSSDKMAGYEVNLPLKVGIYLSHLCKQHLAPWPKSCYTRDFLTQVSKRSSKQCLDLMNPSGPSKEESNPWPAHARAITRCSPNVE